MSEKPRRLGRGLEALLGPISREQAEATGAFREVPVAAVTPNPWQPRRDFDEEALQELVASIEASGLIQPIVVRPMGSRFELIAGERRWRAVQRLGWENVPVIIKEIDDQAALTLALIENLQRDDLTAMDAAVAYQRLMGEFDISQAEVARLVGKNRTTVANTLRLLKLPPDVQALVQGRELSEGHARALLSLDDPKAQSRLARQALDQQWSVRDVEAQVRGDVEEQKSRGNMMKKPAPQAAASADARRIEDILRQRLQTDVRLTAKRRGRGLLTISYYSNDDLARVLEMILGAPFEG